MLDEEVGKGSVEYFARAFLKNISVFLEVEWSLVRPSEGVVQHFFEETKSLSP